MKCPNCGSSTTLSPHPKTPGVTRWDCNGDNDNSRVHPCGQWGTIVPDGLAPPENVLAEQRKDAAYRAQQNPAAPKQAAKKKKSASKKKSAKARR